MFTCNPDDLRWSASAFKAEEKFRRGHPQGNAEFTVILEHLCESGNHLAHVHLFAWPKAEFHRNPAPRQNTVQYRRPLLELGVGDGPETTRPVVAARLSEASFAECLQSGCTLAWLGALDPK
jgi:hypothetical protein